LAFSSWWSWGGVAGNLQKRAQREGSIDLFFLAVHGEVPLDSGARL
jgi:hypothetical protein